MITQLDESQPEFNCFLDYFDDPVLDGVVIYVDDVPFHYNEQEDKYTEFIGNPIGIIFVATERDNKIATKLKM